MPPSPAVVGRSLVNSFKQFVSKDLHTRHVDATYRLVLDCVAAVDPLMRLYTFGSTVVYGVHEKGSDVDFVVLNKTDVEDGKGGDAATQVAKGLQADILAKLARVIRQKHLSWNVEEVRRTRVPVVRVKGGGAVDFDITAYRRNGVRNSALLRAYFEQNPPCRWLSMSIKRWSKQTGLNASVIGGSITSYGFNLMVVYYLLQRNHLQFVPPSTIDVSRVEPLPPHLPLEEPADEGLELGTQVLDFLHFFLHEFDSDKQVISLNRPGITTKEELDWTKSAEDFARMNGEKVHYQWCIEDPYELNLNVGRNVTPLKRDFLRRHLEKARDTALLTIV
ncbi:poly(A) polymerase, putative [Trypanosoma equiperdum]|uniref:Terminal uridylyltransferase 4 n=5 Tax=Trypanozoon TaxID=39700 RepID=TUT4_TRYB2|nr:poly(A) polymerase, putative [Trypanosoma brucei gambiense DAL972]XP_829622.1 poly(A) polymerase, putative [Trypanosoma brucei brucei TREU927]Q381M1.1 RecName: Full=Terminal uridylyltransferase 4; Short=TUTase 4; AltName: Full=3' terminal uridylyl transferase; AltName: Full=RNA editing 3' terminal uridylyltransferase 4; AltName: Full=RNA uridylyltransferase 4 [Trypanosoma brucei brucei TREU927]ABL07000.1 RNA uridylyltransferase 4 [Trypanosoma brucei]RHW68467.1 poly(A) polymerase [Trypanosoma|eukprot:XP_011780900.1 poly(A) polymerase, putative [Trypanosoma brucei gambiense DAL972]